MSFSLQNQQVRDFNSVYFKVIGFLFGLFCWMIVWFLWRSLCDHVTREIDYNVHKYTVKLEKNITYIDTHSINCVAQFFKSFLPIFFLCRLHSFNLFILNWLTLILSKKKMIKFETFVTLCMLIVCRLFLSSLALDVIFQWNIDLEYTRLIKNYF